MGNDLSLSGDIRASSRAENSIAKEPLSDEFVARHARSPETARKVKEDPANLNRAEVQELIENLLNDDVPPENPTIQGLNRLQT